MRSVSAVGRVAAVAAVVAAVAVVAFILFGSGGGGGYTVTVETLNASQLVEGNLVQVGGTPAGTVKKIDISENGQAEIEIEVDDAYAPLRPGTRAVIRQASQSGIANRYVDLLLAPGGARGEIEDGGRIPIDETTSPVELDELFNTLDPVARVAVQEFFKGGARQFRGRGEQANRGLQYLNPALSASNEVFEELSRDEPVLERFLVDSAKLVNALAERRDDLADLVHNLNVTTRALGSEKQALAEVIRRLPDFFRQANTTFVNLRSTLDEVDPLVEASEPVAPRLEALFAELRPFARDAVPTIRDLRQTVRKPGADNDLIDLTLSVPALTDVALDDKRGPNDRAAFPEIAKALEDSAPIIAQQRPYTQDFMGWFDDFSRSGVYDALGGILRTQVYFNEASFFDDPSNPAFQDGTPRLFQFQKCPGSAEEVAADRSNLFSAAEREALNCREEDRSTGNIGG